MAEDDDAAGYELEMPFVVCQTQGGPYDDTAFVAGFRLGRLDALLERRTTPEHNEAMQPGDVKQADLIAMRRGYTLDVTRADDDGEWVVGTFKRISLAEPTLAE